MTAPGVPTIRDATGLDWGRLSEAFDRISSLAGDRRETAIAACAAEWGEESQLVAHLRVMLAASESAGPLDFPAPLPVAALAAEDASLAPGAEVGAFRVERLIGRGGMGEVYLAHRRDVDFRQSVALKMLRPEAAERFEFLTAERRTLAGLEHPGIARLVDGGMAPDGRAYMAMDYVEGQQIDAWCKDQRADLDTRLRLMLELCEAVSHAHARMVIHRDIKPANVLVDGQGRIKLLDFGIARLLGAGGVARPMSEAPLTPGYAAPEQFEGGDLTVATDIYALGGLLHELLSGRAPWGGDSLVGGPGALSIVARRILQEKPAPPSEAARLLEVPRSAIAGDLDAIVGKAMRRAPADRYSSVDAFAADIRNHLAFRPVAARAGSGMYRAGRYIRRNRWGAAAACALALVLTAGIVGTASQARRAERQRDAAMVQAERAEAVNQAMMAMFREAGDRGQAGSISARDLIDSTARRMVNSLDPEDVRSAATIGALSDLYVLTENLPGSQTLLERAFARGIGRTDADGRSRLQLDLAQSYAATRRFADARRLLAAAESVWAANPNRFQVERVEAASVEAYMLRLEGKADQGIALLMRTMPDAERTYANDSRDLATRYANLATHLVMANRLDDAERVINHSASLLAKTEAVRSPAGLTLTQLRGSIAARRGDSAAAEATFRSVAGLRRELYGPNYSLAVVLLNQGQMLLQLNRAADALPVLSEAQAMASQYLGPTQAPTMLAGLYRGEALAMLNRGSEADAQLAKAIPGLRSGGVNTAEYLAVLLVQARLALGRGDRVAARRSYDDAVAVARALGPAAGAFDSAIIQIGDRLGTAA